MSIGRNVWIVLSAQSDDSSKQKSWGGGGGGGVGGCQTAISRSVFSINGPEILLSQQMTMSSPSPSPSPCPTL